MPAISEKTKSYFLTASKFLVLTVTFLYIVYKLSNNSILKWDDFVNSIISRGFISGYLFIFFLFFAAANWYFEILKWQTLVSSFTKIDLKTAKKQCLAALTVSLATPNRIGEYGAKAFFYESRYRKKVLLLNFYSGAIQMLVTSIFGVLGISYLLLKLKLHFSYNSLWVMASLIILAMGFAYFLKEKEFLIKGFSISKTIRFFRKISLSIKLRTIIFSGIRYAIFSSLFLGLLLFFGANIEILDAYLLIFAMYFLVSLVPTLFIFDVIIRGGVAVWLFSFVGIPELTVLSTVLAMWILNFVIPSFLGSFYVITYQSLAR